MLLYKNWLETRFKLMFASSFMIIWLFLLRTPAFGSSSNLPSARQLFGILGLIWFMIPVILAGTGIQTQVSIRPTKGFHGSSLFTLSLPVSRFRLLAERSWLGISEVCGTLVVVYVALLAAFPPLRSIFTLQSSLEYILSVSVCLCSFYFLFVVFAAFFSDDLVRTWTSMGVVVLLRWLSLEVHLPSFLDFFRAMGSGSSLFTQTLPWANMGVSLAASVIFFWVALKIIQAREY